MLVIARKQGESIEIGGGITLTVISIRGNAVRIGIDAPQQTRIVRAELNDSIKDVQESKLTRTHGATVEG